MSGSHVTVVDYGLGNLYSVQRACESCGSVVDVTADAGRIAAAERLILPGVGAFEDGMSGLRARGLVEPLQAFAASGRPLLAICLGMQMLADVSEEFGSHEGLGIVHGRVVPIPGLTTTGEPHNIPRVGWTGLDTCENATWSGTPLQLTAPGAAVYLVHSYHFVCADASQLLAVSDYGGHAIASAIRAKNVVGFQFHPERSGPEGLRILSSWLTDATA